MRLEVETGGVRSRSDISGKMCISPPMHDSTRGGKSKSSQRRKREVQARSPSRTAKSIQEGQMESASRTSVLFPHRYSISLLDYNNNVY